MRIDLPAVDAWSRLCERYRVILKKSNPAFGDAVVPVFAFDNAQHALFETTKGLAKLFSHKKTIAIASGHDPMFDSIAVAFSEEGYNVKTLTPEILKDPSEELAPLLQDLLFVLVCEDDAITGKTHDLAPLSAALKDKRVFRVEVSHALFRAKRKKKPDLFQIKVLSCRPDRALVVAGERCRIEPQLAPLLSWPEESDSTLEYDLHAFESSRMAELQSSVLAFEGDLPDGFETYFDQQATRLFDRTVIFNPEFDGWAVASEVAKEFGATSADSTSPCRWESPRLAEWLLRRGESEDQIRGLVVIDGNFANEKLAQKLDEIAKHLRAQQLG